MFLYRYCIYSSSQARHVNLSKALGQGKRRAQQLTHIRQDSPNTNGICGLQESGIAWFSIAPILMSRLKNGPVWGADPRANLYSLTFVSNPLLYYVPHRTLPISLSFPYYPARGRQGDVGRFNPITGDLVVTGRAKDTIVLSNGENVEPQPLEVRGFQS